MSSQYWDLRLLMSILASFVNMTKIVSTIFRNIVVVIFTKVIYVSFESVFDFNRFDNVKHPFVFIIDMYVINPINDMSGVGTFCHDVKNGTDSNIWIFNGWDLENSINDKINHICLLLEKWKFQYKSNIKIKIPHELHLLITV